MQYEFPPEDGPIDPLWWAPLEAVVRAIADEPRYRFFDLADFMLMGKVVRRPRPDVFLYKHSYIRRYVNLDSAGHAYRYIGAASHESQYGGRYVLHRGLRPALDHLDLWELAWMKPGLEEFRCGLGWDNRLLLHPDYPQWIEEEEAMARRRRSRLVTPGRTGLRLVTSDWEVT